jgi:hypothetical protein
MKDPLNTCAIGQHKRIEVTCLDCVEQLRAEVDALKAKHVVGGCVAPGLVVFPEGSYITAQVERDLLRAQVERLEKLVIPDLKIERDGARLERDQFCAEVERLTSQVAETVSAQAKLRISLSCAELQNEEYRKALEFCAGFQGSCPIGAARARAALDGVIDKQESETCPHGGTNQKGACALCEADTAHHGLTGE